MTIWKNTNLKKDNSGKEKPKRDSSCKEKLKMEKRKHLKKYKSEQEESKTTQFWKGEV